MKKILLSSFVIFIFVAYAIQDRLLQTKEENTLLQTPQPQTVSASPPSQNTPSALYKDGTYTGNSVDAFYGQVQVQAIIRDGKIFDIKFLAYPNDRATSIAISEQSLPILRSEAIQVQHAQVDLVSGATQTSEGFVKSLESALIKAKI
jgi:uncharacterized protein with FMN-binding domain